MMSPESICCGCFAAPASVAGCSRCGYVEGTRAGPLVLAPRSVLGAQYLIGRVLGKPGGTGITYLGYDLRLEMKLAVKEYLPRDFAARDFGQTTVRAHSPEDEESFRSGLRQFLTEARTLGRFDHPNVVRVRNYFEQNGTAYLVMDFYEGLSLLEWVRSKGGRVDAGLAIDIMIPVLDGLGEVHAKGFLHRDIKPANIYLTTGGRPILLDFGAAKQATSERSGTLAFLTPGFAPWEQYQQGGIRSPAADIYACGATLYFMISGNVPPEAPQRTMGVPLVPLHECVPGVPAQVSAAVSWALEMQPERRPQEVRSFQDALVASGRHASSAGGAVHTGERAAADAARAAAGAATSGSQQQQPITPERAAPPAAVAITVKPQQVKLGAIGAEQVAVAQVLADRGHVIASAPIAWSSSNPRVAEVSQDGRIRATGAGNARIEAAHGDLLAVVNVLVEQTPAAVMILPPRLSLKAGSRKRLRADVADTTGSTLPGAQVAWSSANPAVATVGPNGELVAGGAGATTITARAGEATASVPITVTAGSRIPRAPFAAAALVVFLAVVGFFAFTHRPSEGGTPIVTSPLTGSLRINTDLPADASLLVDGQAMATDAERTVALSPGQHEAILIASGYDTLRHAFTVTTGVMYDWYPSLQPSTVVPATGTLRIAADLPDGATLQLDGQRRGAASRGSTVEISAGQRHEAILLADGYERLRHSFTVETGTIHDWRPAMQAVDPARLEAQRQAEEAERAERERRLQAQRDSIAAVRAERELLRAQQRVADSLARAERERAISEGVNEALTQLTAKINAGRIAEIAALYLTPQPEQMTALTRLEALSIRAARKGQAVWKPDGQRVTATVPVILVTADGTENIVVTATLQETTEGWRFTSIRWAPARR